MRENRFLFSVCAYLSAAFVVMQILLVVVSWLVTVLWPSFHLRSLLGGDGVRWLFGSVFDNMSSHMLLWILFSGATAGMLVRSRLYSAVVAFGRTSAYERMALMVVAWEMLAVLILVAVLAFVPHAILLSALGTILPSSLSAGFLPVVVTSLCVAALTYGKITGNLKSLPDAFAALSYGLSATSPVVIVYFFAAELYRSFIWVFCL